MPRRQQSTWFAGYAPGSGLALRIYWAKGRTKGTAQRCKGISPAGHSHRLTSGGKAVAALASASLVICLHSVASVCSALNTNSVAQFNGSLPVA